MSNVLILTSSGPGNESGAILEENNEYGEYQLTFQYSDTNDSETRFYFAIDGDDNSYYIEFTPAGDIGLIADISGIYDLEWGDCGAIDTTEHILTVRWYENGDIFAYMDGVECINYNDTNITSATSMKIAYENLENSNTSIYINSIYWQGFDNSHIYDINLPSLQDRIWLNDSYEPVISTDIIDVYANNNITARLSSYQRYKLESILYQTGEEQYKLKVCFRDPQTRYLLQATIKSKGTNRYLLTAGITRESPTLIRETGKYKLSINITSIVRKRYKVTVMIGLAVYMIELHGKILPNSLESIEEEYNVTNLGVIGGNTIVI